MKYIVVCGGVVSGVGKGVIASSVGKVLMDNGYRVTVIKIDPYLNYDAGMLGPKDHGEVFVLDDGSETDLDLGNYERFLDISLTKNNTITSGRMYMEVFRKERSGEYLGRTVQVVPHLTSHIIGSIEKAAKIPVAGRKSAGSPEETVPEAGKKAPEVCIVEMGGTVGDIESSVFIEALRQLRMRVGRDNFMAIGVEYVISLNGEDKTKPVQASARKARELGIAYDMIICRSKEEISPDPRGKIELFSEAEKIVSVPDCNVFLVPSLLRQKGVFAYICKRLLLDTRRLSGMSFDFILEKRPVGSRIAIVGKYANHEDAYLSIKESIRFAGIELGYETRCEFIDASRLNKEIWQSLEREYQGIVIPGGFGKRGVENMVSVAGYAREKKIPFLGICLGFQVAVIEFVRSVLGIKCATSEEFVADEEIRALVEDEGSEKKSATAPDRNAFLAVVRNKGPMRMGLKPTRIVQGTFLSEVYKSEWIHERFRHRYGVNPDLREKLEKHGLNPSIVGGESLFIDAVEAKDHPYFVAVQYHPEFLSRPYKPHPLFTSFIKATLRNFCVPWGGQRGYKKG
jgi:CTP synthase